MFMLMQYVLDCILLVIFFFKQKTAYEMRISDWSSDVCSSDLASAQDQNAHAIGKRTERRCRLAHLQATDDLLQLLRKLAQPQRVIGHNLGIELLGHRFGGAAAAAPGGGVERFHTGRGLRLCRARREGNSDLLHVENSLARIASDLALVDQCNEHDAARNLDRTAKAARIHGTNGRSEEQPAEHQTIMRT